MHNGPGGKRTTRDKKILLLVLAAGLINGLIFVFLVPPWQHYDEPSHFEYSWLIAHLNKIPDSKEWRQPMRRELAASMIEHGFFETLDFLPNLVATTEPVWIGLSQLDDPPAYYLLSAIPLKLLGPADFAVQLFAVRLLSLALFLLTILIAFEINREVFPEAHQLRWMVPLFISFLPGFSDLMTSLNNDVGATFIFSLFIWGSIRVIRHGLSWQNFAWISITAAVCLWTKMTILIALPIWIYLVVSSLTKKIDRRYKLAFWALAIIFTLIGVLTTDGIAGWHRTSSFARVTQEKTTSSPLGNYSLKMVLDARHPQSMLFQVLPRTTMDDIRGAQVTIGAWIWATQPLTIRSPILDDGNTLHFSKVRVDTTPAFYSFSTSFVRDSTYARVILSPLTAEITQTVTVHYDGLVLSKGHYPDTAPNFDTPEGIGGTWGDVDFLNLLGNGSLEKAWPTFRPWIDTAVLRISNRDTSQLPLLISSILDWPATGWYYKVASRNLLESFWAKFGWGHIPLPGAFSYHILGSLTLAGILGALMGFLTQRKRLDRRVWVVLGLAVLGVWGSAIFAGIQSITGKFFLPSARFAYPGMIPTAIILNFGWLELFRRIMSQPNKKNNAYSIGFVAFLLALDAYAIFILFQFYWR